jgi:cytochrome c
MTSKTVCIMALFLASAVGSGVAEAGEPAIAGLAFVQAHCSSCHATGRSGASPNPEAPPFRTLHERYDVEGLAEALAEGIVVGHRGARQMPRFVLNPGEIDAVIAYLKSLELPERPSPKL